ncbi:DEAD/DEAH box helicase [Paenibacillus agilis]|uniref:ATP-dependent helicase n=1 Tax=Paenibacillus agilis TaxID=3020863 RepID=A0A559IXB3_9BACL|nr:DEAD/DEAH box helicase family protein [Paenibacillus agilis]TVX92259.1 ATP-dependent helicase [Paenibacillus agilis]
MLQITISNNIRLRDTNIPIRAAITDALTVPNPAYIESKKKNRGRNIYGLEEKLRLYEWDQGDLVVPRGFALELQDILRHHGINPDKVITWNVNEPAKVDFGPWNTDYPPRDYQIPAVASGTKKAGVLVSPAGSGKTLMACATIHAWGVPTLWLTHTIELMNQSADAARKYMPGVGRVGRIGDNKLDWGDGKLIVATVQTLANNPTLVATLNKMVGALVIDEAHHFPAIQFIETVGKFNAKYVLGVTATPKRKDFLEVYLYRGVGPVCYEVPREALHDAGSLIKPEVRFIYTDYQRPVDEFALDNVDAGGEDIHYTALIQELTADEKRARLVVESILESCIEAAPQKGGVIVLADSVRYLWVLHALLKELAGSRLGGNIPRMGVVHGGMQRYVWRKCSQPAPDYDTEVFRWNKRLQRWEAKQEQYTEAEFTAWQVTSAQRKVTMAAAYNREIDILFATGALAREGLDMPHLSRGHLTTPARGDARTSANGASVEQAIGRIQRPDPNNPSKNAVWYDYVDFDVGVFQDQYYSRRKVYKRLGLNVPKKKKSQRDRVADFLKGDFINFGSLPL